MRQAGARRAGEVARLLGSKLAQAVAAHTRGIVEGNHERLRRAARGYEDVGVPPRQARALHRLGQIAERLHLSKRTVESHLARIYARLAISGRKDLSARLAPRTQDDVVDQR